jgi:hypothetical protein
MNEVELKFQQEQSTILNELKNQPVDEFLAGATKHKQKRAQTITAILTQILKYRDIFMAHATFITLHFYVWMWFA